MVVTSSIFQLFLSAKNLENSAKKKQETNQTMLQVILNHHFLTFRALSYALD